MTTINVGEMYVEKDGPMLKYWLSRDTGQVHLLHAGSRQIVQDPMAVRDFIAKIDGGLLVLESSLHPADQNHLATSKVKKHDLMLCLESRARAAAGQFCPRCGAPLVLPEGYCGNLRCVDERLGKIEAWLAGPEERP